MKIALGLSFRLFGTPWFNHFTVGKTPLYLFNQIVVQKSVSNLRNWIWLPNNNQLANVFMSKFVSLMLPCWNVGEYQDTFTAQRGCWECYCKYNCLIYVLRMHCTIRGTLEWQSTNYANKLTFFLSFFGNKRSFSISCVHFFLFLW